MRAPPRGAAVTRAPASPEELAALDAAHLWHPYAAAVPAPLVYPVESASGVRLRLCDGRELIDGMSSWWAAIHGYRVPELDAAVEGQLGRMAHVMFGGLTHAPAVDLGRRLVELAPPGLSRVFFCDSGSVAVEVALKMALQYWQGRGEPGRRRFLAPRGGYHGDTFLAMSLCDPVSGMHHLFRGVVPEQLFAERPPAPGDPEATARALADMAALLERHASEIAAVVLEPIVQGAGGMRFHDAAYLAGVRGLCDEHGVLLVLDEIATGFGRTGRLFAAEHAGVAPDILCLGKALTGGYLSFAATLCTQAVATTVSRAEAGALLHG
ncbi:MAG: adenosylmethionine--8-amino-7-oxononanoate transaminase, partial [Deltaproteobacteria bacterium]|nr:adenosylmethionine--8-amino-7-oxononanoate transaminase [Deltaproteobacteria bacterium]